MTDQASGLTHTEEKIDSTHAAHHIVSPLTYAIVLGILMVLTVFTVWVANLDAGGLWNLVIALGIATVKATIVTMWFMHVKYSGKLIKIIIITSLLFLGLMISGTLMDVWTRSNVTPAGYIMEPEYERMHGTEAPHGDNNPDH